MSWRLHLAPTDESFMRRLPAERLIYLATPYSLYAGGLDAAAEAAAGIAGVLIASGARVFSPIAHFHAVARARRDLDPRDGAFWARQNLPFVDAATGLVVALIPGWAESIGVAEEIDAFTRAGKPIWKIPFREAA